MSKVIWFTGISGAGKSTLAERTVEYLQQRFERVEFLDGNEVRDFFENDLGFEESDRHHAIKRSVFGSALLAKHGVYVVVASIAARYQNRDFIRRKLGENLIQIWIKASIETVRDRDVRGLYKSHDDGSESNLPGIDQIYDQPRSPDLVVETDSASIDESFDSIRNFLDERLSA